MRVEQIMSKQVRYCLPSDTLAGAAQLMWELDCGSIPVCEPSNGHPRIVGMVTDRDICMNALFSGKPLSTLSVSGAMSKQPHSCHPSDNLKQAESIMRDARVRRLPVVDEQGTPVGLLSLADLAREAARERQGTSQELTITEIGDTLASISQPLAA